MQMLMVVKVLDSTSQWDIRYICIQRKGSSDSCNTRSVNYGSRKMKRCDEPKSQISRRNRRNGTEKYEKRATQIISASYAADENRFRKPQWVERRGKSIEFCFSKEPPTAKHIRIAFTWFANSVLQQTAFTFETLSFSIHTFPLALSFIFACHVFLINTRSLCICIASCVLVSHPIITWNILILT